MADYSQRRIIMVDTQVRPSDVTSFPILDAMLTVPRELFVPTSRREAAYIGEHVPLGDGRVVLDPRSLAKMLEAIDILPDELVLDVGAGLGYSAAVIARLAEAVVAIEDDADRIAEAEAALGEAGIDNVAVVEAPLADGAPKHGPYDVITVQGGIERFPEPLARQLKEGGRAAAIFMDGALGVCRVGYKMNGEMAWRDAFHASAPVLPGFAQERAFQL